MAQERRRVVGRIGDTLLYLAPAATVGTAAYPYGRTVGRAVDNMLNPLFDAAGTIEDIAVGVTNAITGANDEDKDRLLTYFEKRAQAAKKVLETAGSGYSEEDIKEAQERLTQYNKALDTLETEYGSVQTKLGNLKERVWNSLVQMDKAADRVIPDGKLKEADRDLAERVWKWFGAKQDKPKQEGFKHQKDTLVKLGKELKQLESYMVGIHGRLEEESTKAEPSQKKLSELGSLLDKLGGQYAKLESIRQEYTEANLHLIVEAKPYAEAAREELHEIVTKEVSKHMPVDDGKVVNFESAGGWVGAGVVGLLTLALFKLAGWGYVSKGFGNVLNYVTPTFKKNRTPDSSGEE